MPLSDAQRHIFSIRSELGKVAVPCSPLGCSVEQMEALRQVNEQGWFIWIDTYINPDLGILCNVFQITEAGRAALEKEESHG